MKRAFKTLKIYLNKIPVIRTFVGRLYAKILDRRFYGSEQYWIERYRKGGNSGDGSYNKLAEFKSNILNNFVNEHEIRSVIEYGCGDGNQLRLGKYPRYSGFDISPAAVSRCREIFRSDKTKSFNLVNDYSKETAELTLSLDVVYHLIEDEVFESYIRRLFDSSSRFVIVYSSNKDEQDKLQAPHVKHRKFTEWIRKNIPGWKLIKHIPNRYPYIENTDEGSHADFYIYEKT
jgi:hypothetical protein